MDVTIIIASLWGIIALVFFGFLLAVEEDRKTTGLWILFFSLVWPATVLVILGMSLVDKERE
jgi:ABC-type multidrug transport system permease subunit